MRPLPCIGWGHRRYIDCLARQRPRLVYMSMFLSPLQGVFTSFYYTSPSEAERCDNEYGPTPTSCNASWAASDALQLAVDIDAYYAPSIASQEILCVR